MSNINQLFENNRQWAKQITTEQPDFFLQLSQQQNPEYLWIGCSDSRVPANNLLGLPPGDVFVHRNIANQVIHTDLNCLSVIHFAVEILKVEHIIVCGHYGCGGIVAAIEDKEHGMLDHWLRHIKDIYSSHKEQLDVIKDKHKKADLLCELNVIEQVNHLSNNNIIKNVWKNKQPLCVHGLIYQLHDGLLKNLNVSVSGHTGNK